jgi:hypothetical protein
MISNATQFIHEQALRFAAKRLERAAQYLALHVKPTEKGSGRGNSKELIRWEWPGILSVYDADTGALLAQSEAGQPSKLSNAFKPTFRKSDSADGDGF